MRLLLTQTFVLGLQTRNKAEAAIGHVEPLLISPETPAVYRITLRLTRVSESRTETGRLVEAWTI